MFKFVRKGALMLLAFSLVSTTFVSCDDDDPNDNVVPPTVEVAPNTVSGVLTGKDGSFVVGATVTLGSMTTTTDANGGYIFNDVKAGSYPIKAEAEGRISVEGTVEIKDAETTQNEVWSAILAKEIKKEVVVSKEEDVTAEIEPEVIPENDKAKVKVVTEIPADAVDTDSGTEVEEGDATIVISPIYNAGASNSRSLVSRASTSSMLVGATIACSVKNAKLKKPIKLSFNVDDVMANAASAMMNVGGGWSGASSSVNGNVVTIEASDFGSYGLFLNVNFDLKSSVETIFEHTFDNLYGEKPMSVENVPYSYQSGMVIKAGATVLEALLVEKLAFYYGFKTVNLQTKHPLNVVLPVGTKLDLKVTQKVNVITASIGGASVSGTNYGAVNVMTKATNRQHSGGMN